LTAAKKGNIIHLNGGCRRARSDRRAAVAVGDEARDAPRDRGAFVHPLPRGEHGLHVPDLHPGTPRSGAAREWRRGAADIVRLSLL